MYVLEEFIKKQVFTFLLEKLSEEYKPFGHLSFSFPSFVSLASYGVWHLL